MNPEREHVVLVTVLFNSGRVLEDFLASVESQTHESLSVVFVDNASTDDSVALVRARMRPNWRLIENADNLGVAAGNNVGIACARSLGADRVLLINNDTVFGPTFVADLLGGAVLHGRQVVTPLILAETPAGSVWYNGGTFRWFEGLLTHHLEAGVALARANRVTGPTPYAPTCALLVQSDVFDRVGVMDETYFVYHDDVDFMLRLRRERIPVIVDRDVTLLHKASALTGGKESDFSRYWESRGWMITIRKHSPNPLVKLYYFCFLAAWLSARILVGKDSLTVARRRLRGFRDGLAVELGSAHGALVVPPAHEGKREQPQQDG